jgi:hypothetical protein
LHCLLIYYIMVFRRKKNGKKSNTFITEFCLSFEGRMSTVDVSCSSI